MLGEKFMKALLRLILIIGVFSVCFPRLSDAKQADDALLSALALNYCRASLVKILNYNDRIDLIYDCTAILAFDRDERNLG